MQFVNAFIKYNPVVTSSESLYSDPYFKDINEIIKARVIAHELYHATGYMGDFVREGGLLDLGKPKQKGADFPVFRDHIMKKRGEQTSGKSIPALEEGSAVLNEVRFYNSVIQDELPKQAGVYAAMADIEGKNNREAIDAYIISELEKTDKTYSVTMEPSYPDSFLLVSYLHQHAPDFERQFEGMRLRGNRTLAMSDLHRNIDGWYGVGTWKDLLLATEGTAGELLNKLQEIDREKEGG